LPPTTGRKQKVIDLSQDGFHLLPHDAHDISTVAHESTPVSGPPPNRSRRSRWWLGVALAYALLRALPSLSYPIGRDQSTYLVIARGLAGGAKLYRDLWDMKPPGIFWAYMPIVKAFGAAMWSIGAMDILWLVLMCVCVYRFAERTVGTGAAVVAVAVEAAMHCGAGYNNAVQPETFLILFVFAAWFQVAGARPSLVHRFAGGLLFGAAFWFKYNALAFLPLLLLVPHLDPAAVNARPFRLGGLRLRIPWRGWLGSAAAFLGGFAATVAGVLGYFGASGLWTTLWESHYAMVPRYGASPWRLNPDYWVEPIVGTIHHLGVVTLAAPLAALVVARRRSETDRVLPAVAGAALAYASVAMLVRFLPSAFEACYPFFAVAWGYLAVRGFEAGAAAWRGWKSRRQGGARSFLWVAVAAAALWPVASEGRRTIEGYRELVQWSRQGDGFYLNYPNEFPKEHLRDQMRTIRLLEQEKAPGDQLYVWGFYPLIYYLAGMSPPTRFVPVFPLIAAWGPPEWREELMRDLQKSPPRFMVVARNDPMPRVAMTDMDSEQYLRAFPELNAFVSANYREEASFPDFIVYRFVIR